MFGEAVFFSIFVFAQPNTLLQIKVYVCVKYKYSAEVNILPSISKKITFRGQRIQSVSSPAGVSSVVYFIVERSLWK